MKAAFTIIELLVVFSIITIFSVLTIPSYISFNRTQEVKQGALFLKSQLRDTQNRSFSGEKISGCDGITLDGLYADITLNENDFETGIRCGGGDIIASVQTQKFSSSKISIKGFYQVGSPCVEIFPTPLRLLFKPIGKGVEFYNWSGLNTVYDISKVSIEVGNDSGSSYFLTLTKSGEIYESPTCQ